MLIVLYLLNAFVSLIESNQHIVVVEVRRETGAGVVGYFISFILYHMGVLSFLLSLSLSNRKFSGIRFKFDINVNLEMERSYRFPCYIQKCLQETLYLFLLLTFLFIVPD